MIVFVVVIITVSSVHRFIVARSITVHFQPFLSRQCEHFLAPLDSLGVVDVLQGLEPFQLFFQEGHVVVMNVVGEEFLANQTRTRERSVGPLVEKERALLDSDRFELRPSYSMRTLHLCR